MSSTQVNRHFWKYFSSYFLTKVNTRFRKALAAAHRKDNIDVQRVAFGIIDGVIENLVTRLAKTSPPSWFFERLGTLNTIYCAGATDIFATLYSPVLTVMVPARQIKDGIKKRRRYEECCLTGKKLQI